MYVELFQLEEPPFQLAPDPQFLFASPQHVRAKTYMESTVLLGDGFVVLTGEIGCGKTTLVESFISELPDDFQVIQVTQTRVTAVEFLQTLLVELGFEPFEMRKIELLTRLKKYLAEQLQQQRKLVVIIDEAQNLSSKVLEEVRLLSGIETGKEKALRIIMVGQPELKKKLDSPRLEQLKQRVRLQFHLSSLSKPETFAYIQHRLDVAGASGRSIFDDEALDLVYLYSGGVPRLINTLCDTSMLVAFGEDQSNITEKMVELAANDLQWVPYSDRENRIREEGEINPRQFKKIEGEVAKLNSVLEELQDPAKNNKLDSLSGDASPTDEQEGGESSREARRSPRKARPTRLQKKKRRKKKARRRSRQSKRRR